MLPYLHLVFTASAEHQQGFDRLMIEYTPTEVIDGTHLLPRRAKDDHERLTL